MDGRRDPVQRRDDGSLDLQDVADWEPRSLLDRFVYGVYTTVASLARAGLVVLAVAILAVQFALGGFGAVTNPVVGTFVVLSAVPALVLAGYVRFAGVTRGGSLPLLVVTFTLGLLFAGFAGLLNAVGARLVLERLEPLVPVRDVAMAAFFFAVVGPVEETVKLLAVRLYAYRQPAFDAVIDGAVYGAAAGLGFATIENALYISRVTGGADPGEVLAAGGTVATFRALAGPGHVIYSAFAGYYLGLARFNREYAGPIVLKGLFVATLVHGTYNALVLRVPDLLAATLGFSEFAAFVTFVVAYDGIFAAILVRRLSQYRAAYRQTRPDEPTGSELTEFDP